MPVAKTSGIFPQLTILQIFYLYFLFGRSKVKFTVSVKRHHFLDVRQKNHITVLVIGKNFLPDISRKDIRSETVTSDTIYKLVINFLWPCKK